MLFSFQGQAPRVDPTAYVQRSAQIIGDVVIGAHSSIWFNTVLRGDVHFIRIGSRSNVQDNSTLHVTGGLWPTIVGDEVTIGHGAIVHGCRIGDRCLIGMGAIVMDGAEIGDECLVAAGALVTPGTKVAARQMVVGSPARVTRGLDAAELTQLAQSAQNYVERAALYRAQGIV